MKDLFEIEINEDTYKRILDGKCNFLVLLDDHKKKPYVEGNILTLIFEDNKLEVVVKTVLSFLTVKEMIEMVGKENCGFAKNMTIDRIEDKIALSIKPESIEKFGLEAVGFEIK